MGVSEGAADLGLCHALGLVHHAGDEVDHVLDEVPGVDDPGPLGEAFADEVGFEGAGAQQLEGCGANLVAVPIGYVVVGAADGAAGIGDVVDDQHVFALDRALGHGVADGGFVGFLGRADVVFHLEARQVVEAEEITETTAGEPAAPSQRDDDVGLEVGGFDLVAHVATEAVDVLPVRDRAVEFIRQIGHA